MPQCMHINKIRNMLPNSQFIGAILFLRIFVFTRYLLETHSKSAWKVEKNHYENKNALYEIILPDCMQPFKVH